MVRETTVDAGCGAASYALSPMQQGMLFHQMEGAAPGVDVEQVICELRHPVSVPEFEQAWELVMRRHDALRTRFEWSDGAEPAQVVMPSEAVRLPVRVLDFAGAADIPSVIEQYLASDRRAGFDVRVAPLVRVALFMAAPDHAWFVFSYHHLVLDARAMYILFKQVLDLHDALLRGQAVELPPVRPYRDYIAWLQTLDTHRAETFWREQLQGLHAPTVLPLPGPAAAEAMHGGMDELAMRFAPAQAARLREAAARHQVTLNTLLQGAWAVVLSGYTGEDDVVFGAVRACRHVPLEGAASIVGMLINTVPLRVRLASAAGIGQWLRGLREQWVALRDYEHTPLMQVQQWSDLPGGRALFETLFNYQEPSWIDALARQGGIWEQRSFEIRSQPNYPLSLDIYGDDALHIRAFYDRGRYAAEAVARMLRHFGSAIEALADPRLDVLGAVTLLDAAERRQLLETFNATGLPYERDTCVHAAFERQAAEGPDRIAVTDAKTTLTYAELNTMADALAARLRDAGVARDVPVAVCMKRSAEMVVAWMAALKAGGAFVPLDPEYPPERLRFQVADCGAPVVVLSCGLADTLQIVPPGVTTIEITPGAAGFVAGAGDEAARAVRNPPSPAACDSASLAYIIYTSGSTGQPKGVAVEHRALMNLVSWHQRTYGITPADRATHLASPAFDASVWEIWPYLTAGASVHLPDEDTRITPERLWRWLAAQAITVTFMPTPLAEAALAEPLPPGMSLRFLLTGGDRLKRPAPAGLPFTFVNHYGPTESTVVATSGIVSPGTAGAPPIGRPIANTTALVLDREMRPVPVGVVGELFLGGESLARGYHRRPDLTAEKFVVTAPRIPQAELPEAPVDPDAATPVRRLYRTGDLVRWRGDGQLEFVGRRDNQVKIRGCRIEPGEIEAVLQRHPGVREALVLAGADERGHADLVGYVLPRGGAALDELELLEFVRRAVPAYMVPAGVAVLEAWPLTANGKIDRRALPLPTARSARMTDYLAPQTSEQQTVARIWAEVLGRETIGLNDNFFEIGGHSLLAARAITHLNAALGISIPVRTMFDHPTVADFASQLLRQGASVPRPAIRSKRRPTASELELVQPR